MRVYHFKGQEILPCLLSKDTFNVLHQESPYFFNRETSRITTLIEPHLLKDSTGDTVFQHKDISYVSYLHGKQSVTGYRFGSLCYITDISAYTTQLLHFIQGSEILVISLTRPQASQLHIGLEEVTKISQKTNIQKTFLTHISHNILHQSFEKNLPLNIYLAYDGLELAFSW